MNGGPQEMQVFNLTLYLEQLEEGRFRARAIHRAPGMTAGITFWPERTDLEELLRAIERQYQDFEQHVTWSFESEERRLELSWGLNSLGHVVDGRADMADGSAGWTSSAPLVGDQSFLPGIAMGLHLVLRI